ncbi:Dihydrofolate reductase [Bacteroidales bacterium Barb7]|nr:Dihydrofolate reductase [Bacteroidales bacterium Barb7]
MTTISIIAAVADNNAIGRNGQLLCRLPNDMKRFKELTTGHSVIMGHRTYESLPKGALPSRKNIVLTSQSDIHYAGCTICNSFESALAASGDARGTFIIGGAAVYGQALEAADKMYLTRIRHTFADADTFFPVIDFSRWEETERQEFPADDRHDYPYTFLTYIRRKE